MQYAVFLVNCTSAWYVHKKFFLILRLMTYTDFCSVGRSVSTPQQNETVKQNIREIDRHDRRYMYIPSFAFPISKTTCHAKPYLYMSVQYQLRDVNEGVGGRLIGYCFQGCCCRFCCGAPTTDERIHARTRTP